MLEELRPEIWIMATVRRLNGEGLFTTLRQKGDPDRGTCIVIVDTLGEGSRLFRQIRTMEGHLDWISDGEGTLYDPMEIMEKVEKATKYDPDLWIVEVEDKTGKNPFQI